EVQHYLREVLEQGGVDPLEAEELTVLPGADEVLALLELRAQAESGFWDVVAVERLHADLVAVQQLLTDPSRSSVRLVLTPEAVVVAEARRTLTSLSLYGYLVDGVVAN